jgi:hypothetical protein
VPLNQALLPTYTNSRNTIPAVSRERLRLQKQKAEMLRSEGLVKARSALTRYLAKPGAVLTSEAL